MFKLLFTSTGSIKAIFVLCCIVTVHCISHGDPPAPPAESQWVITFEDNFDGSALNTAKWGMGFGWGRTANFCSSYMADDCVTVANGLLKLEAKNIPTNGLPFRSGGIHTKNKFKQKYGYWEARIKTAPGKGMWMAYWSKQNNENWPPEIDFVETMGSQFPDRAKLTVHYRTNGGTGDVAHAGSAYSSAGFYSQFHTYGVWWDTTGSKYYIDGMLRYTTAAGIDHFNAASTDAFYTMIGLQTCADDWMAPPDATTLWGTDGVRVYVDWARCYKLEGVVQQTPYLGVPYQIPGLIEAEDFDNGGESISFHDTTTGNSGAQYRTTDVDIETCVEGGFNVGWTAAGEWLEYTATVSYTGRYDLLVRTASTYSGKTFHVECDEMDQTGSVAVPLTGGWQSWQTVVVPNIHLTAGSHIIRFIFDTDKINLNYFSFVPSADINADGIIDIKDLSELSSFWLEDVCLYSQLCQRTDLEFDNKIDMHDFARFAEYYNKPLER